MNSAEIGALLGSGKEAEVYEYGEFVLKLYRATASKNAAFREAAILAIVESSGLPAPKVLEVRQYGSRWGLVMTRASGLPFANAMLSQPALISEYLGEMVRLHRHVHGQSTPALPELRTRLTSNIRRATALNSAHRERLLRGLESLSDADAICHGDFHPWNLLGSPGQAMIVDWLDACRGSPAADVCRSYVLMHHAVPKMAASYVEAYARASGHDPSETFAWLPFVAAARLAEGVSNEEDELIRMANAVSSDI
jgi:Ser/Thr protein kinase RdoA (MazF antagonist)